MKNRCNNVKSEDYLNGISYCPEWEKFIPFYEWATQFWYDKLHLHRKDKTKDYSPDNCYFGKPESLLGTPEMKERIRQTNLKKYGFAAPSKHPDIKRKIVASNLALYPEEFSIRSSRAELDLLEYANSFGYTFYKTWDILKSQELDMFCPELNLAFEYNGVYYHSDRSKDWLYHYNKFIDCVKLGICLVFVWEDEWKYDNERIRRHVASVITKQNPPEIRSGRIENGLGLELFIDKNQSNTKILIICCLAKQTVKKE